MKLKTTVLTAAIAALAAGTAAKAQPLTTVRLQTGLIRPLFVTAPPGDKDRLFIVEQRGSGGVANQAAIRILNLATNTINVAPFLTVSPVTTGSEQGLLGLAFAPDYATTGRFYISYTNTAAQNVVARGTVSANPDIANPTITSILTIPDPFSNHNGGWIGFGPDGYLYVPMGDGGSGGDPQGNGQNLQALLGKVLRLDVSGSGTYTIPPTNPYFGLTSARQEIWAYGVRNPWRPSFDRQTGDFYIADVGQDNIEEINYQPAIGAPPYTAVNYGWRCFEGNNVFSGTIGPGGQACPGASTVKFPFHTYTHSQGCSITGGYVYRGCAIPGLRGTYFFADYCSNTLWSLRYDGTTVTQFTNRTAELAPGGGLSINQVVSFGEDDNGEIYICDQGGGELYKIIPRCPANCDGSASSPLLTANDFSCFLNQYADANCYANCDGIGGLTPNDFLCYLNAYSGGCS
jgi:glucose/arabinose dehydrogenase